MTNEQLVIRIKAGIDVADNMLQLWQQNRGFIHKIVNQYKVFAEAEDLEQEGYLGLSEAVNHYNPDEGVTFLHYASYWIKQHIVRHIKSNGTVRLPEHIQERIRKYNRIVQKWQQDHHRSPSDEEICYFYGVSEKMLDKVHKARVMAQIGSLDVPVGEESDGTLYDLIPSGMDDKEDVLNKVANEELAEILWGMVEELPGRQSEVLKMRFKDNMKLREIGAVCGCSIDRARQIENKGLRTLRNPKRSRILREFLDDERIYNSALHGNSVSSFSNTWTSSTERVALRALEG